MKTKTIIASVIAIVIIATNVVATGAASAQTRHTCRGHVATIVGTPGRDVINGTSGPDVIVGLGGNDVIRGRGGADIICGNGGNDTITGNGGSDTLDGGKGKDRILGKSGNDVIFGGSGKDVIRGAKGNDTIYGQKGKDRIYGGSGSDRLHGGTGNDVVDGGSGNDHLDGGLGADTIRAGNGTDYCVEGLLSGCAPTRLGREISSVTSERCDFWGRWSADTRDVNGRIAEHALSCSADDIGDQGWIEYDLGRRYNRFGAQVGIDDDALAISDRYRFRVYGDGALLHSVDVGFGELVPINVSVSGVLRLRLEITKIDGLEQPGFATHLGHADGLRRLRSGHAHPSEGAGHGTPPAGHGAPDRRPRTVRLLGSLASGRPHDQRLDPHRQPVLRERRHR